MLKNGCKKYSSGDKNKGRFLSGVRARGVGGVGGGTKAACAINRTEKNPVFGQRCLHELPFTAPLVLVGFLARFFFFPGAQHKGETSRP